MFPTLELTVVCWEHLMFSPDLSASQFDMLPEDGEGWDNSKGWG